MIEILLNGEPRQVPGGLNVRTLLSHLGIDSSRVAVELNRRIVRKDQWDEAPVESSAQVEVVEFVGGGAS